MNTSPDLEAFIVELHERVERGEFLNHPPIRLEPWIELPNVDWWIRKRLADVDRYRAMDDEERRQHARGRRELARELLLLRERLAGNLITDDDMAEVRARLPGWTPG